MPSQNFLLAISHAVSGSVGTATSTAATYPLDLVNTRIKVQRQLARDGTIPPDETYDGPIDALKAVWRREGGLAGLYAGLGSDLAKSVADSFLFFLFYNWFRARRLARPGNARRRRMGVVEELAVGAVAGACARALTMPVANVVTRIQTAALVGGAAGEHRSAVAVLRELLRERGVAGLWAGYSAALVLTLNPSITFFLDQALRSSLASGEDRPDGGLVTFFVAAVSKAVATAATFPFQIAKARLQVSSPSRPSSPAPDAAMSQGLAGGGGGGGGGKDGKSGAVSVEEAARIAAAKAKYSLSNSLRSLARDNIFTTVSRITREEGVGALYDGLGGELLKAFFSHGITMLSKDAFHKVLVRLYFALIALSSLLKQRRKESGSHGTGEASGITGVVLSLPLAARGQIELLLFTLLGSSQRLIKT
ncbi:hypothetical protein PpBr36_00335 [Pyricularia pennisetigena]|uniref:hypothetical protein n=1 Tax=Pyricularia pennisetigena TaxID=1578925 RepID=UPI00114E72A6|nr:hypothetical protein PpBr36_00335 [Pyricularia pennisetigena]TLS29798.1 hypothetical protein PpBr36_00335 [Pyricularia pennisetigena]